jgi:hypothetical protein
MQFLSDEHLAAATAAINQSAAVRLAAAGVTLAIVNTVTGAAGGDFTYYIRIGGGVVEMARGTLTQPDAEVRSSYDTAAGIARGEIANQTAVMTGKVRIKGSMLTLLKHASLLNQIQALSSTLPVTY